MFRLIHKDKGIASAEDALSFSTYIREKFPADMPRIEAECNNFRRQPLETLRNKAVTYLEAINSAHKAKLNFIQPPNADQAIEYCKHIGVASLALYLLYNITLEIIEKTVKDTLSESIKDIPQHLRCVNNMLDISSMHMPLVEKIMGFSPTAIMSPIFLTITIRREIFDWYIGEYKKLFHSTLSKIPLLPLERPKAFCNFVNEGRRANTLQESSEDTKTTMSATVIPRFYLPSTKKAPTKNNAQQIPIETQNKEALGCKIDALNNLLFQWLDVIENDSYLALFKVEGCWQLAEDAVCNIKAILKAKLTAEKLYCQMLNESEKAIFYQKIMLDYADPILKSIAEKIGNEAIQPVRTLLKPYCSAIIEHMSNTFGDNYWLLAKQNNSQKLKY